MIESFHLRDLLLPELEAELDKTRRILDNVPDGQNDFKSHEKSMPLSRLAGHVAELPGFAALILTTPSIDMGTPTDTRKILRMDTQVALIEEFKELADKAITAVKHSTDETFNENWQLLLKGRGVYSGSRYGAYRNMFLNHMIHHRAQLGVYLRLLNIAVPSTFGPTADEPFKP
jgi:uncharacterized damage-inducible protein DinB